MMNSIFKRVLAMTMVVCMMLSMVTVASAEGTRTVIKEPTCTTAGIEKITDENGVSKYVSIPARHTVPDDPEDVVLPTCGEDGEITYVCTVCQKEITEVLPATGEHDWNEDGYVDATCTENAKGGTVCRVCEQLKPGTTYTEIPGTALGHDMVERKDDDKYVEPTCTEEGYSVKVCSRCDAREEGKVEALGHKEGEHGYLDADCLNNGRDVIYCAVCGDIMKTEDVGDLDPATGHDPQEAVIENEVPVTCEEDGSYDEVVYCGNENCPTHELSRETKTVPSTGAEHDWSELKELKPVTCTTSGIGKKTCSICGVTMYESIPAEHKWQDVGESTATCTAGGTQHQYCPVCEEEQDIEVVALGHDLDEGVVTKEPTCGDAGVKTRSCKRCDYTEPEAIPATGEHDWNEDGYVDATCTENAKGGTVCRVCEQLKPGTTYTEIPGSALGHDMVERKDDDKYVEPTCTEEGYSVKVCSRCDAREEGKVDALGHKEGEHGYLPADCLNNGRDVIYCAVCGDIMNTVDLGDVDPMLGHDLSTKVVDPTCSAKGYTIKTCSRCDLKETVDEKDIDPEKHVNVSSTTLKKPDCEKGITGVVKYTCGDCGKTWYDSISAEHKVDSYAVVTKPTCTETGREEGTCSLCGQVIKRDIPALGHNMQPIYDKDGNIVGEFCLNEVVPPCTHENTEVIPGHAATCIETGLTEGKKCSVCGEILTAQKSIPVDPKNHAGKLVTTVDAKAATCTEDGCTEGQMCEACCVETMKSEPIPATGHTAGVAVVENEVAATCTEGGSYDEVVYCTVCGEELSRVTTTTEALGHTEETMAAVEPTCTETGLTAGVKCSVCGEILVAQETVDAKGHTEETMAAVEPTCTETGLTAGVKCSVCGEILVAQETVDAKGHNWSGWTETKAATCTEDGAEARSCSACGAEETQTIAAKGHSYTVSWSFNEDFTKKIKTTTCTVCGETTTEEFDI